MALDLELSTKYEVTPLNIYINLFFPEEYLTIYTKDQV